MTDTYRSYMGDTPVPAAALGFAGLLPFFALGILVIAAVVLSTDRKSVSFVK